MRGLITFLYSYLQVRHFRRFFDRAALNNYQKKKLKKHLNWVCGHSPYYSHLQGKDLDSFPIADKKLMMDNFDLLNTKSIKKNEAFDVALQSEKSRDFSPLLGGVTIGLSSGTSGSRGLFLASDKERATWAGAILAKVLPTCLLSKNRIALFLRANSNLYTTLNSKRIKFQFFDLIETSERLIDRLNRFQPSILVSPPSMLRILAQAIKEGKLRIKPIKIISAAEVLDPIDDEFISREFKQKVHQIYQCTEGFLGHTCQYGTLHLNEDMIYIEREYLNPERTKFIPIITDMGRTTQPIIRYRLNDILTVKKEPCECASPLLALDYIEGRSDDLFYFENEMESKLQAVFPDFIRRSIISATPSLLEYRVLQHSPQKLELSLLFDGDEDESKKIIMNSMQKFFKNQNLKSPEISFSQYTPHSGLKKLKRVECLI